MILDPLETLKDLVRFPSVSADPDFKQGMDDARNYLKDKLMGIGFEVEVIETPLHPIVLAERKVNVDAPTVVVYGHYDVQPPDPLELWESEPFEPEVRGDRIYGRGSADNKGPVATLLATLSEVLSEKPDLPLNITFLLEGEEEIGSPSFKDVLEKYKDRLTGDFVLACDTGSQKEDQIVVTTALRGIACIEVKAKNAKQDVHSGIFGGAFLNPIQALIEICNSLHNEDGTINVPGFHDAVAAAEDWERDEIAKLNMDLDELKDFLGIRNFYTQPGFNAVEGSRFAPTLEFNGIGGGYQGDGSKTVIPSEAFVKISCRLVANQDADLIQQQLIEAIKERCPEGIELEFITEHTGQPYMVVPPGKPNTPADQNPVLAKAFNSVDRLSSEVFGKPSICIREGGSIPIMGDIKHITGMDTLLVGIYLPEDGMHAPNESFSLTMMNKGKALLKALFFDLAN